MRLRIFIVCLALAAVAGCGTVTPKDVNAQAPSWSVVTGKQDSDIVGYSYDAAGKADGFIVTGEGRSRYNALITLYGARWTPPLATDYGITALSDGNWRFSAAAMVCWSTMADLARKGTTK